jgi:hypothetical protein
MPAKDHDQIEKTVRRWIGEFVVGLNLCPFAAPAIRAGGLRVAVSRAGSINELQIEVTRELELLAATPESDLATSVLAVPALLEDFADYNQFLDTADALIDRVDLSGVIQVASFHPQYQFAGAGPDDIENYTNRSPYPLLHFLRESMVTEAVDGPIDTLEIPGQNKAMLERLGRAEVAARLAEIKRG